VNRALPDSDMRAKQALPRGEGPVSAIVTQPPLGPKTLIHDRNGNCWAKAKNCSVCGEGSLCDVCHEHDEPRGDCSECLTCYACRQDQAEADRIVEQLLEKKRRKRKA
jgi:hypothetical protein